MARKDEILLALSEDKSKKNLHVLYLAVVNIVLLRSQLLMISPAEQSLGVC